MVDTSDSDRCPEYIIVIRCGCGGIDLRVFLAISRVVFLVGTIFVRPFSPWSVVAFFVVAVLLFSIALFPNVVDVCLRRRHVLSQIFSNSSKFVRFENVGHLVQEHVVEIRNFQAQLLSQKMSSEE